MLELIFVHGVSKGFNIIFARVLATFVEDFSVIDLALPFVNHQLGFNRKGEMVWEVHLYMCCFYWLVNEAAFSQWLNRVKPGRISKQMRER